VAFAQIFERHITAEAESGECQYLESAGLCRVGHDRSEVFGSPTVVKPRQAVKFSGAASEVPGQH
jgi:hypothetical protein